MESSSTVPVGDDAILRELGVRLAARRVDKRLTQDELAAQAGVGKRTVERLEHGRSAQLTSYVRVLRVLGLVDGWMAAHPPVGPTPMQRLRAERSQGKAPKRVRAPSAQGDEGWRWGDDG